MVNEQLRMENCGWRRWTWVAMGVTKLCLHLHMGVNESYGGQPRSPALTGRIHGGFAAA